MEKATMKKRARPGHCYTAGNRGFTLVELAIVLAIVGLMTSGAMMGITSMRENAKLKETSTALRDVEHSLTLFVMRNGRLPWADTDTPPDGDENLNATFGGVPYNDLGLGRGEVTDGWENSLLYGVDDTLAAGSLNCSADGLAQIGALGILDATSNQNNSDTFTKVAYVTISPGGNEGPETPNDAIGPTGDGHNLFRSEGIVAGFDDIVQGRAGGQILRDGGCRLVSELKDTSSKEYGCTANPGAAGCSGDSGDDDEDPDAGGVTPGADPLGAAVAIADMPAGNVTTGGNPVHTTSDGTGVSAPDAGQVHVGHQGNSTNAKGVGNNNNGLSSSALFEFSCPRDAYAIKLLEFSMTDRATVVGKSGNTEVGTHVLCAADDDGCDAFNSYVVASGAFAGYDMGEFTGRFGTDFDSLKITATNGTFWIHDLRTQKTAACPDDPPDDGGDGGGDGGGGGGGQCTGNGQCPTYDEATCRTKNNCTWVAN